ncbi:TraB/GumN family protein [Corynebacterium auris]|uniref:TraB/GumN family protein n=1 Tax=Corynebacterium auris TaxID=44750 RepID=UPI0025B463FA|nr:TraB/GumN family protein [Corynebacterium auris]WJY67657.1 TraB family protein [Corynebacterium auris]
MPSPTAFSDSLFWSVTSPAGAESLVFGTIHVIDDTKIALPLAHLEKALRQKGTLVLEIDPRDLDELREQGLDSLRGGEEEESASETLSPRDVERLDTVLASSPRLAPMKDELMRLPAASLVPLVGSEEQLRSPLFSRATLEPELYFADYARRVGADVVALENVDVQLAHLREDADLPRALDSYFAADSIDIFERYARQDLDVLADKDFTSPAMLRRNRDMAAALQRAVSEREALVLVGVAHLPRESGILARLARAGWGVSRVELGVEKRAAT